jgi:hypothetical protein
MSSSETRGGRVEKASFSRTNFEETSFELPTNCHQMKFSLASVATTLMISHCLEAFCMQETMKTTSSIKAFFAAILELNFPGWESGMLKIFYLIVFLLSSALD